MPSRWLQGMNRWMDGCVGGGPTGKEQFIKKQTNVKDKIQKWTLFKIQHCDHETVHFSVCVNWTVNWFLWSANFIYQQEKGKSSSECFFFLLYLTVGQMFCPLNLWLLFCVIISSGKMFFGLLDASVCEFPQLSRALLSWSWASHHKSLSWFICNRENWVVDRNMSTSSTLKFYFCFSVKSTASPSMHLQKILPSTCRGHFQHLTFPVSPSCYTVSSSTVSLHFVPLPLWWWWRQVKAVRCKHAEENRLPVALSWRFSWIWRS